MATFSGILNTNEVIAALYNMIISIQTFADNIDGLDDSLVNKFRVDGGLYGDTKLYISTDALESHEWGNDAESLNLLALDRAPEPMTQAIDIDEFRQIRVSLDNYMTKRAFDNEGSFAQFNGVIKSWLADTKKIYDTTRFNVFVGTTESTEGKQTVELTLPTVEGDAEATNRLEAQTIAQEVADLLVELKDVSRDFNDYGFIRAYKPSDLVLVWNSDFYNKITKLDLPTIFHKDGMFDGIKQEVLPAKYFGVINESETAGGANIYSLEEQKIGDKHYFAGEAIKEGTVAAGKSYTANGEVICKIMHKNSVPYMSGFECGTSFFNPRSLTETNYLTFGRNSLEYLAQYPFITVKVAADEPVVPDEPETPDEPATPDETTTPEVV